MAIVPTSPNDLFKLFDQLNAQSYHINPLYIDMTGSLNAGFLLTQLIFLSRSFKHDQFYRTDQQLRDAYRFGSKELINARKTLMALGVVEAVRKGNPPKWHYRIVIEKIIELSLKMPLCGPKNPREPTPHMELAETATLNSPKRRHCTRRNGDTNNKLNNDLNNKKENKDHPVADPSAFDRFWKEYPRKVTKGRAVMAFKAAIKKTTVENMIDALTKQKAHRASKGPKDFVPDWKHPASWLNGECWADELDVPAKKQSAEDQFAHFNTQPRMHKTEEESKKEIERALPKETASPQHVSKLMESVRKDLGKQNMETRNVRNHSRGVVPTVEQRHRDGGEEFITRGCA